MTKAIIYARCSTEESKQDVEVQLKELRRYCQAYGWEYDEVYEYESGFTGTPPKLKELLEKIRLKHYDALLVSTLDRFSREHPKKTNMLLDRIVYDYNCRFISLMEGIDSSNEMIWHVIRPLFTYFANIFSRNLSSKVKAGIKRKKEKGEYRGGRPKKKIDMEKLKGIAKKDFGWRRIAAEYNKDLPKRLQISYQQVRRVLRKGSLNFK